MSKKVKKLFIGPSNESWLKFHVAGWAWKLTRGNKYSSYTYYIPFSTKIAMWAFKVRVMSRDFELQSTDEDIKIKKE